MKPATMGCFACCIVSFLALHVGLTAAEIQHTLSYTITEEVPIGTNVGEVAQDSGLDKEYDLDVFNTLQLSIVDQGLGYMSLFRIGNGGSLETASRIDRDELCPAENQCIINLDIQVNPSQYFQIIKVTLEIFDKNDNAPFFRKNPVSWPVNEGPLAVGEFVTLNTAVDNDSPIYGVQRYSLNDSSGNFDLRVQNSSGAVDMYLYLKNQLDREVIDSYSVQVLAYDGGSPPKQGSLLVNIDVQDINDNKPEFDNQTYSISVSESLPISSTILQVSAKDKDIGPNGKIVYGFAAKTLEEYGSIFEIDSETGEITLSGSLDHEDFMVYTLTLTAHNEGPISNSMSSLAKLIVNIIDANDNAPSIKVHGTSTNTVEISESAEIGEFVAHITVQDPDTGNNGKFTCTLNNNFFKLQQMFTTDFKIITTVKLDREIQSNYNLGLVCQDQGVEPKASTRNIFVNVKDENDNPPRFTQQTYGASILENNNRGSFITRVQATDKDAGKNGQIRYKLMDSSMEEFLILDSVSGNITAKVSFDHEVRRRLDFRVVASDLGEAPNTATTSVVLEIMDIDDERPEFSKQVYDLGIYEGEPIKSEVGQVSATDRDSEPFNKFTFSLNYDEKDANSFTIEPLSGRIYTSEILDWERKPVYKFVVSAISLGLHPVTSTAAVSVFVADKNDENPSIDYPTMYNNTVYLSNRADRGQVVSRIRAHDRDSPGKNSRLTYHILSGNEEDYFSVDESSGAITVEKDMSYISHQLFGLVVSVRDHGSPPRMSEAFLNIIVNKSIGHTDGPMLSNQNLTIVITIASVSGFLMVILVIAIVILLRWPWLTTRKYNYIARLALSKNSQNKEAIPDDMENQAHLKETNLRPDLASGKPEQSFSGENDLAFINVNFNEEADGRCKQIRSNRNSRSGIPERAEPMSTRQPERESLRYQKVRTAKNQLQSPSQAVSPAHLVNDKDSDSACSADMSNATDSGRGSTGHDDLDTDVLRAQTDRPLNTHNGWSHQAGHNHHPDLSTGHLTPGVHGDRAVRFSANQHHGRRRPPPVPPSDYTMSNAHGSMDLAHNPMSSAHRIAHPNVHSANTAYMPMTGHASLDNVYQGDGDHGNRRNQSISLRDSSADDSYGAAAKNISHEIHV